MILHCVFCDLRPDVTQEMFSAVASELANFSQSLVGVERFEFGPNRDFESKSAKYTAGFVVHFHDKTALENYADHPTHKDLGARLCELCNGGADGVIVFDLETSN